MNPDSSQKPTPERWWTRPVTRRSLLAGGLLGYGLCKWIERGPEPFVILPELPPDESGVARGVRFFVVGDVGLPGATRDLALGELFAAMRATPAAGVLLLGDNFYPDGVASIVDEQWQSKFERLFPPELFPIPFHACLGNHDYNGNAHAQVEYSAFSPRWRMPNEFYSFQEDLGDGTSVEFFVLDTLRVWKDHSASTPQLEWFEDALAKSTAAWKIVMGHHCIRSNGVHGPISEVARRLEPLLDRYRVDLYMSGHDHDLELLRTESSWMHLVSGAGSTLREMYEGPHSLFAASKPGFAALIVQPEELRIEFFAAREGRVFAHTIRRRPLVPVSQEADEQYEE